MAVFCAKMSDSNITAPKVELSENIQKFDARPRVRTDDPWSFSGAKKKQEAPISSIQTASQMIANPLYNEVGKVLGVDTINDWGLMYDKVHEVVELAKAKSGIKDNKELTAWLYKQLNYAPSLGSKKINDVLTYLKMGGKPQGQSKPKVITKTVIKKVYVKPKQTTEQFVSNWMKGQNF